jgi:hypothetical protein
MWPFRGRFFMRSHLPRFSGVALFLAVTAGCQSTPAPVTPPPVTSAVVSQPFEKTWEGTRDLLLQQGLQIYTRDKRGLFVVFTPTKRVLLISPRRTKMTIALEPVTPQTTRVSVETIKQHYRVTLLTFPDWRDEPKGIDPAKGQALLDAIVTHTGGTVEGTSSSPKG